MVIFWEMQVLASHKKMLHILNSSSLLCNWILILLEILLPATAYCRLSSWQRQVFTVSFLKTHIISSHFSQNFSGFFLIVGVRRLSPLWHSSLCLWNGKVWMLAESVLKGLKVNCMHTWPELCIRNWKSVLNLIKQAKQVKPLWYGEQWLKYKYKEVW